jgi:1-acyl-sn-glycerol-3-phosphate acyltransferase
MVDRFRWYAGRYLRKHFHAVRVSAAGLPPQLPASPAVVVLNHPSWWDPLMGCVLSLRYPDREPFIPMDAAGLAKYPFLGKLGFFGVETGSLRGAARFLRTAEAILARPKAMLWVTAQGKFTDPRVRPTGLQSGVGHLAHRIGEGVILPLALEYPFWSERTPEALARFGEPIDVSRNRDWSARDWTEFIGRELGATQDALAEEASSRDPSKFVTLIDGRVGVGGVYDLWRRARAWLTGRRFDPRHGERAGAEP